jgi:large subunit ribosomal protein L1
MALRAACRLHASVAMRALFCTNGTPASNVPCMGILYRTLLRSQLRGVFAQHRTSFHPECRELKCPHPGLRTLSSAHAHRTALADTYEEPRNLRDAIDACLVNARKRFDETVDLCVQLNLDVRKPEHNLRGLVRLPAGVPKVPRVAVFTTLPSEAEEARAHGAALVGAAELVSHIQTNGITFERCLATPEALSYVARVARQLGPRGLVPSEKLGTVGVDIGDLVDMALSSVQFRTDAYGQVHVPVGKVSFGPERIQDNVMAVVQHLLRVKPDTVRRRYLLGATLSRTQGPGIEVAVASMMDR